MGDNPKRFNVNESESINVLTTPLDFLNLGKIDLIKIDTEGWEFNILKGAISTLEKYKPDLFIEVNDQNMEQCSTNREELFKFLGLLGYHLVGIIDDENYHFTAKYL